MARSLIGVSLGFEWLDRRASGARRQGCGRPPPLYCAHQEAAMPTTTRLDVQPITGELGAEISGVDLGADLDDATIAEIRQALLEHGVIFFRDQEFDAEQHKRLARRFGEIFVHPNYAGTQADPEIVMIRREPGDTRVGLRPDRKSTRLNSSHPSISYAV